MRARSGKILKFFLKLMRHPGTPESVGRGVAVGLFSAFFLPGLHIPAALLLAMLVRGARGTAMLITLIINPVTIPFIWPVQCYLGNFLLGQPLSQARIEHLLRGILDDPSLHTAGELSGGLAGPFFAGGALLGTLTAIIGYFTATALTRRHRARLATRKAFRINRFKVKRSPHEID